MVVLGRWLTGWEEGPRRQGLLLEKGPKGGCSWSARPSWGHRAGLPRGIPASLPAFLKPWEGGSEEGAFRTALFKVIGHKG